MQHNNNARDAQHNGNGNGTGPSTSSPKGKPAAAESSPASTPQGPPNPFFGARVLKKGPPIHIKDDFNPFKYHKVVDAAQVCACTRSLSYSRCSLTVEFRSFAAYRCYRCSRHLAIQRQAVHADVPAAPRPAAAAVTAHAPARAATADATAPSVRGAHGPRRTGGARVHLLPAVPLPWPGALRDTATPPFAFH